MQIGEVIRKYRLDKNMTQEEMARRLGVTAPAVNKWENSKSMPDISLLAPIARLLGISVDTLLSFESELTTSEINQLITDMDSKFNTHSYDEVFQWAKSIIVFCKHFLEKVAKHFWRMLHLQIGESCKASAGSYKSQQIRIADII